jgi:hypothetical protein
VIQEDFGEPFGALMNGVVVGVLLGRGGMMRKHVFRIEIGLAHNTAFCSTSRHKETHRGAPLAAHSGPCLFNRATQRLQVGLVAEVNPIDEERGCADDAAPQPADLIFTHALGYVGREQIRFEALHVEP